MSGKYEECEDSAWEIALADLMTTLMVFFLVMWLTSIISPEARKNFISSVTGKPNVINDTSGSNDNIIPLDGESNSVIPLKNGQSVVEKTTLPKKSVTKEEIQKALENVNSNDITIKETKDFTKITLRSDSFFESGRANIKDKIREQLEHLGETLANRKQAISIIGYTDNIPISNLQFPSNWELSAARAATIARTFIYMGVQKKLVQITGRADNDAVAPNKTAYGRSLNRRVVILINKNIKKE